MDYVLDRTPQRCSFTRDTSKDSASFQAIGRFLWARGECFDDWIEIKDPNKIHIICKDELYYDGSLNAIKRCDTESKPCSGRPNYALINSKEFGDTLNMTERVFQVGDVVKIVKKVNHGNASWTLDMDNYLGTVSEITEVNTTHNRFKIRATSWDFNFECAELVRPINTIQVTFENRPIIRTDIPTREFQVGDRITVVRAVSSPSCTWRDDLHGRFLNKTMIITEISQNGSIKTDMSEGIWLPENSVDFFLYDKPLFYIRGLGEPTGGVPELVIPSSLIKKEITFTEPKSKTDPFVNVLFRKKVSFIIESKKTTQPIKTKLIKKFTI